MFVRMGITSESKVEVEASKVKVAYLIEGFEKTKPRKEVRLRVLYSHRSLWRMADGGWRREKLQAVFLLSFRILFGPRDT